MKCIQKGYIRKKNVGHSHWGKLLGNDRNFGGQGLGREVTAAGQTQS